LPDFTAHWYQKDAPLVSHWEFQFQKVGGNWEWVQQVEPVDGCQDCFQAVLRLPETAILVRSRAVTPGGHSGWSESLSALPEPDFTVGLALCAIILIWLAGIKWGGGY
tara:strand:- start:182 stop:505 length:324 start_codon:yes stop_codon:yes gene_type:complete